MTPAQIDTALEYAQQFGLGGVIVVAVAICVITWIKHGKRNGNGKLAVDNAKENAALTARIDTWEKQNEKEHKALEEKIDKNNERLHERLDAIESTLAVISDKVGVNHQPK